MAQPPEDRLTRLPLESLLHERLPRELLRASSFEHPISLLGIRVEVPVHLKTVAFYPVLKAVARKVRGNIRTIDLAVRLGDDIVLMLAETPPTGALRLGEKLTEVVDHADYDVGIDLPDLVVHLRCAVASYPADGSTPEALLGILRERLRTGMPEVSPTSGGTSSELVAAAQEPADGGLPSSSAGSVVEAPETSQGPRGDAPT